MKRAQSDKVKYSSAEVLQSILLLSLSKLLCMFGTMGTICIVSDINQAILGTHVLFVRD